MSEIFQMSSSWKGFSNLDYLIIFGDSYSDVGYSPEDADDIPGELEPLGIPYPGNTFADGPNWVGYLATTYSLIAFDYARGGEKTTNLNHHLENHFLPQLGDKPEYAPWTKENSLFVTWIGINDCAAEMDASSAIGNIFHLQERLYESGARNFLLIDMPPIHRTPVGLSNSEKPNKYEAWNEILHSSDFGSSHPDATTLVFSSWNTFTRILDDPVGHGFEPEDLKKWMGGIWMDHLHPTSAVHKILADDIAEFLVSQKPAD
ncbi:carbohydrate esterase family 16 protein [Ramaria rubella]|nr:carbohydrate esterase family 16 protein [Ramaria rubella]